MFFPCALLMGGVGGAGGPGSWGVGARRPRGVWGAVSCRAVAGIALTRSWCLGRDPAQEMPCGPGVRSVPVASAWTMPQGAPRGDDRKEWRAGQLLEAFRGVLSCRSETGKGSAGSPRGTVSPTRPRTGMVSAGGPTVAIPCPPTREHLARGPLGSWWPEDPSRAAGAPQCSGE